MNRVKFKGQFYYFNSDDEFIDLIADELGEDFRDYLVSLLDNRDEGLIGLNEDLENDIEDLEGQLMDRDEEIHELESEIFRLKEEIHLLKYKGE